MSTSRTKINTVDIGEILRPGDLIVRPTILEPKGNLVFPSLDEIFTRPRLDYKARIVIPTMFPFSPSIHPCHGIVCFAERHLYDDEFFYEVAWSKPNCVGLRAPTINIPNQADLIKRWSDHLIDVSPYRHDSIHDAFDKIPDKPVGLLCVTMHGWDKNRYHHYDVSRHSS